MKKASQPRWPWLGPWSSAGDVGPGGSGASVDEVEPPVLPGLEPLRHLGPGELRAAWAGPADGRESRRRPTHVAARIVDDSLDGTRVFALPPLRPHRVSRLGRLASRMQPAVWLVLATAVLSTAAPVLDALPRTHWTPGAIAEFALRLGFVTSLGLLPAGVLIWRPDAWRSARAVLIGAVMWSTVPALAGLGWWATRHSAGPSAAWGPTMTAALAMASIAAGAAPAIMAFGLDRVRRAHDSELRYLAVRACPVAAFLIALTSSVLDPAQANLVLPALRPGDPAPFLVLLRAGTLPIEVASLVLLAYVCLSAVLDSNPQPKLWQLSTLGVGLLGLVGSWELVSGHLLANAWMPALGLEADDWGLAMAIAQAAGAGMLLASFGTPVWSLARDAAPGLGTPDDVFAWGSAADATGEERVPIGAVATVAAGADHALAMDDKGRVAAWGDNSAGQAEVPADLGEIAAIAAGDRFSLALRRDGTVAAWGSNEFGQTSPPSDLTAATAICAGADFGLALRRDGTVAAWGNAVSPAVDVPVDLRDVVAIAAGKQHGLALRRDGTVATWGANASGQLKPPARLGGVVAISAGGDFCLALRSDGTVAAWGDNTYGQLEVPQALRGVIAIAAGAFHGVALCGSGAVVSWGSGRIEGEGSHPWRLLDFRAVAAGHEYSLAIRAA